MTAKPHRLGEVWVEGQFEGGYGKLQRHLSRGHSQHQRWPVVEYLEMEPTSTVEDTFQAARVMRAAGSTRGATACRGAPAAARGSVSMR